MDVQAVCMRFGWRRLPASVLLTALVCIPIYFAHPHAAAALQGWNAESPGASLTGASVATVQFAGELHVFGASSAGGLGHMVKAGNGTWTSQDLDAATSTDAGVAAVALGSELHVFGQPATGTGLRHVWWGGGAWHSETVDSGQSTGTGLGAVVYYGQVQVFGARAGGPGLRQALLDPGSRRWYFADLDIEGSSGQGVWAGVFWGDLHLFGSRTGGSGIRHDVFSPGAARWLSQDLEVGVADGAHASVAYGLGELHVFAPAVPAGAGVRHAVYSVSAGSWVGQTFDANVVAGVGPVAAFVYGELHLFDAAPGAAGIGHLVYSTSARQWVGETLDAGASTGEHLAAAPVGDQFHLVDAAAAGGVRHVFYVPRASGITITGHGWGHGVGLSQYGAAGWARQGASAQDITLHYFRNTVVGPAPALDQVRVGVAQDQQRVTGSAAQPSAAVCSGTGATTWFVGAFTFQQSGGTGSFSGSGGGLGCATPIWVNYGAPSGDIYLDNAGHHYRHGTLELSVGQGGTSRAVMVIFAEGGYGALDVYLYGLGEMPSSWPAAALQAQALAGRSYAAEKIGRLGQHRSGCDCGLTSTTSDQAYVGFDKESETGGWGSYWVAATRVTAGQTINYGGSPIPAYYAHSSGGWTENVENVWGGSAVPYLVGVPDPYDGDGNKYETWSVSLTWSEMQARLNANPSTAVGTLYDVQMSGGFGVSGRPLYITISGSSATKVVRSATFQAALGLKSTLFAWAST